MSTDTPGMPWTIETSAVAAAFVALEPVAAEADVTASAGEASPMTTATTAAQLLALIGLLLRSEKAARRSPSLCIRGGCPRGCIRLSEEEAGRFWTGPVQPRDGVSTEKRCDRRYDRVSR